MLKHLLKYISVFLDALKKYFQVITYVKTLLQNTSIRIRSDFSALESLIVDYLQKSEYKIDFPIRKGEIAVVTGGGRGLGKSIVQGLVKCGMHVVIGVRKPETCKHLAKELEEGNSGTVEILHLDTASLKSIQDFANIVTRKYPKLSILVNNAGTIYKDFSLTEDGFETHLGTNYLGHFYLTHLLMRSLERAGKSLDLYSRIVNISSCCYTVVKVSFDDINLKKNYTHVKAYAQSKLCQIMFTKYLDHYTDTHNISVKSYACHPGVINSGMMEEFRKAHPMLSGLVYLSKTCDEGAAPVLYSCLSEELEGHGGHYIVNCHVAKTSKYSNYEEEQDKLFRLTCKLLSISQFGTDNLQ